MSFDSEGSVIFKAWSDTSLDTHVSSRCNFRFSSFSLALSFFLSIIGSNSEAQIWRASSAFIYFTAMFNNSLKEAGVFLGGESKKFPMRNPCTIALMSTSSLVVGISSITQAFFEVTRWPSFGSGFFSYPPLTRCGYKL
ncbi:hypothetical protein ABFS83_13G016000 [Erythranthe nasuta]